MIDQYSTRNDTLVFYSSISLDWILISDLVDVSLLYVYL